VPLDLNAARALHDRDPGDPARCRICHVIDGGNWPCDTAVALGATGRTEWEDATPGLCGHTPEGIGFTVTPCNQADGHTGSHTNRAYKWHESNTEPDGYQISHHRNGYPIGDCQQSPDCIGPTDHPGSCVIPWHPCGDYSTRSQGSLGPCVRDNGHNDGPHRDQNGGTW
jgi:hypothetical protein